MSKYVGKDTDVYGNIIYVCGLNDDSVETSTDVRNAILLTNEDKLRVKKLMRKSMRHPFMQFIKLEKFDSIHFTTYDKLRDYEQDYYDVKNVAKLLRQEDDMSLECIDYAKNHINEVNTFEEFGNNVAKILIEKYNLKKKEQPF